MEIKPMSYITMCVSDRSSVALWSHIGVHRNGTNASLAVTPLS